MVRALLIRGMLAGFVAGLLVFGFGRVFGEPPVDLLLVLVTGPVQPDQPRLDLEPPQQRQIGGGDGAQQPGVSEIGHAFEYGRQLS